MSELVDWDHRPKLTYGDTKKWHDMTLQYLVDCKTFMDRFDSKLQRLFQALQNLIDAGKKDDAQVIMQNLESLLKQQKLLVLGHP